jgi:ABC-type branched-subunit amino acid transport system ATPase component
MSDTIIRAEKLGRDFKTVTAADDLSLEVPAGAVFGFLGPNGAGSRAAGWGCSPSSSSSAPSNVG